MAKNNHRRKNARATCFFRWSFMIAGIKALYYTTKKKEVDRIIRHNLSWGSDKIVFGLNGTRLNYYNSFYPLCKFLKQRDINFIPLSYNYKDNPDAVCTELYTRLIGKINNHRKVIFVTHSYGGVVARYLIARYLGDSNRFTIITIASPNKGIDVAKSSVLEKIIFWLTGLMDAEKKGSRVLGYLDEHPLTRAKIITMTGEQDSLVTAKEGVVNKKDPDHVIGKANHLSIIYSPDTFEILAAKIAREK